MTIYMQTNNCSVLFTAQKYPELTIYKTLDDCLIKEFYLFKKKPEKIRSFMFYVKK